ncbi:hypothetical protein [Anabaena sp. CCY 0017]|uniref:hypothetical protein n=1 Tax=Anabaena sp. CCY 0017 TaxID=3103866 RepID=UPI0039C73BD1
MKTYLKQYCINYRSRTITALILTGILSVGSGYIMLESATAGSTDFTPKTKNEVLARNHKNRLPPNIANAVQRDLARRLRIPNKDIKIIDYRQQTWKNGCLELPQRNELCTQVLVPGWRIVLSNNKQNWIYHTNDNGRSLRLASANTPRDTPRNPSRNLPESVKNAVFQAASQRLQIQTSQLTIIEAQQQTWNNGCLNLAAADEFCTQALVQGWRVTVGAGNQTLVYHTNQTGSAIRLNEQASKITDKQLPQRVKNAVIQAASQRLQIPTSRLSIIQTQQQNWRGGCLELANPGEGCTRNIVQGWRVVVGAGNQTLVYHTNQTGSAIRLNEQASKIANQKLPQSISDAVLRDASNRARAKIAVSTRNITQAEKVVWTNGCLDLGSGPCTLALVPGWRVTVAIAQERFVYHTDESSLIKFNSAASKVVGNPGNVGVVAIPSRELPRPLTQGMVFRQISSGGLLGKTYETVLLNDGNLMQVRIGDANDSERRVWRISSQQVQQFQQLLERSRFPNLSYPAPRGAADYVTYTLTSRGGTIKYNDVSQNNLPPDLLQVVNTWNRIITSAQR